MKKMKLWITKGISMCLMMTMIAGSTSVAAWAEEDQPEQDTAVVELLEIQTETENEPELMAETETESETEAESETELESETETETESETETEPAVCIHQYAFDGQKLICSLCEEVDDTFTGLKKYEDNYYYLKNGVLDQTFTGFASTKSLTWYCESGVAVKTKTGLVEGKIDGVQASWYVYKGYVKFDFTGVIKSDTTYCYVKKGKFDNTFKGFALYGDKYFYMENGVKKTVTALKTGTVSGKKASWYVKKGILQNTFTGIVKVNDKNRYIKKGVFDNTLTGYVKYNDRYYYVSKGIVNSTYKGFATKIGGTDIIYMKDGNIYKKTGLLKVKMNGVPGLYYLKRGFFKPKFTGISTYNGSKWFVYKGKVKETFTGYKTIDNVTYYIKKGKLHDGWAKQSDGCYYYYQTGKLVKNSYVDGYRLDAYGKSSLKQTARSIVDRITTPGMTEQQKISACFNYITSNYSYRYSFETLSNTWTWPTGWTHDFAVDMFSNGSGNCYRYACSFAYLVKEATGCAIRLYHGTYAPSGDAHGWCTVYTGGAWRVYDTDGYLYLKEKYAFCGSVYGSTGVYANGVFTSL